MNQVEPQIYIQPDHPAAQNFKWVVIGASVQGRGHIHHQIPCQDTHAFQIINTNTIVAVVADGLGSALQAEKGAKLASATALQYFCRRLADKLPITEQAWIDIMRTGFHTARASLVEAASEKQSALHDFATTLISVIVSDEWLVCGQIGDGAVVAHLEDDSLEMISAPQNGEYINVTFPLTMPEMETAAQFTAWPTKIKSLAMMTDGMQHVSIRSSDNVPHPPFFEPLFRQLPGVKDFQKASANLADFMASDQVSVKTDDDKTLLLIGKKTIS